MFQGQPVSLVLLLLEADSYRDPHALCDSQLQGSQTTNDPQVSFSDTDLIDEMEYKVSR